MQDWIVGLLAIAVGALFCFRGFMTMRIVIPIWGAFTGFILGAGLISAVTDDGFLGSALAWIVGIAAALLFGAIAYLYYEVSVMLAMGAIGFSIGTSVMVALGGASIIVFGVMLLTGVIDTADFESVSTTQELEDDWWWYGLYIVIAVVGGIAQIRHADRMSATMRQTWADAGGRELRTG